MCNENEAFKLMSTKASNQPCKTFWKMANEDVREQIVAAIGPYGKWQLMKCIYLACIIWIGASFHLLNMVFYRWELALRHHKIQVTSPNILYICL